MSKTMNTRFVMVAASALLISSVFAPGARADIIEVEGATSCPGSLGGGLCNGSTPYTLSALLTALAAPNSIAPGTQKYVVTDDINNSFSFGLQSTGQNPGGLETSSGGVVTNGTGTSNNGACQINGGAMSFFTTCSIVDANGQTTTNGTGQINNMAFPITITFGSAAFGHTFDLGFVSMQGYSNVGSTPPSVPEPTSVALLATVVVAILVRKRVFAAGASE